MSSKQWLALAAWVLIPVAASAQQKQSEPNPLDASAPVSALTYESAFKDFRASSDEAPSPDKVWRRANDEMGQIGGHAGQMKATGPGSQATPKVDNAAPKQGGAVDHSKHH